MNIFPSEDSYIETVLANGFTEVRHLVDYDNSGQLANSKAKVLHWVSHGAHVIWGVTSHGTTITSTNWTAFHDAILSAATWAQANGVFEFQIGNEEEYHNDNTTLTDAQLITNLKSTATEVQAIFTNGNVSYSCLDTYLSNWISAGRGNIDLLASNVYRGGSGWYGDSWKTVITNMINGFGVDHTYLTEFSLSFSSLDNYSTNEAVQAAAVTEMIDYIKASGMTRAIFFMFKDDGPTECYGVLNDDGVTYRLLWNSLINSGN